jgi:hypothetical protein
MVHPKESPIFPGRKLPFRLFITCIFLLCIGFDLPVYGKHGGASWQFLEKGEEGIWFYDHDPECPSTGFRIARTKKIYNQTGVQNNVGKYGEGYLNLDQAISVWEIDCPRRKFRLLSAIFYAKNQSIIECYDDEKEKYFVFEDIPIGSYLELLSKKICR